MSQGTGTKDSGSGRKLLTIAQTAEEMNCSARTVWRLVSTEELKIVRLGRAARIDARSVDAFIANGGAR